MQNEVCVDNFNCCNSLSSINENGLKVGKYTSLADTSVLSESDSLIIPNKKDLKSELNEKYSEDSNSSSEGAYENLAFILSDKSVSSSENEYNIHRNNTLTHSSEHFEYQSSSKNSHRLNKTEAKHISNINGDSNAFYSLPLYLSSSTPSSSCSLNNAPCRMSHSARTKIPLSNSKLEAIAKFHEITLNLKHINCIQESPKCICKNITEKKFNCNVCTQNYPVNVRRSKDGEEETNVYINNRNMINSSCNFDKNITYNQTNRMTQNKATYEKNNITNKTNANLYTKPPISSNLLSILALNKPGNVFIPPPNVSLQSQSNSSSTNTTK